MGDLKKNIHSISANIPCFLPVTLYFDIFFVISCDKKIECNMFLFLKEIQWENWIALQKLTLEPIQLVCQPFL